MASQGNFLKQNFPGRKFNNLTPAEKRFLLKELEKHRGITIVLFKAMYEFKTIEESSKTTDALNVEEEPVNSFVIESKSEMDVATGGYAELFPEKENCSTASENVHIVDDAFYIPQLDRYRRIWIYLPGSYSTSNKKYPVLYMQDGQNVFDEATSAFGEWGVDETLDSIGSHHKEIIVVAIDNGGEKPMNEYSPYDMENYGSGEGDQYIDFLVQTLKPYIDKQYRTKKDEKNTFIAGSSMGGLISFYAILKYPKVFGGAGVFSPAFWMTAQLKNIGAQQAKKVKGKIYFYVGREESEHMVFDMLNVVEQMRSHSKAKIRTVIRQEGKHNEPTWRNEFPLFYQWLL